jgi:hypothetical protein
VLLAVFRYEQRGQEMRQKGEPVVAVLQQPLGNEVRQRLGYFLG